MDPELIHVAYVLCSMHGICTMNKHTHTTLKHKRNTTHTCNLLYTCMAFQEEKSSRAALFMLHLCICTYLQK